MYPKFFNDPKCKKHRYNYNQMVVKVNRSPDEKIYIKPPSNSLMVANSPPVEDYDSVIQLKHLKINNLFPCNVISSKINEFFGEVKSSYEQHQQRQIHQIKQQKQLLELQNKIQAEHNLQRQKMQEQMLQMADIYYNFLPKKKPEVKANEKQTQVEQLDNSQYVS